MMRPPPRLWFAAAGRANRGGVGGAVDEDGVAVLLANASLGAMILDGRGVRGGPDPEAADGWPRPRRRAT